MGRGRPKGSKNKSKENISKESLIFLTNEETKEEPIETIEEKKEVKSLLEKKITGYCDLCGKEIYSGLTTLNLTHITGKAHWHRMTKKDKLVLCSECAEEFSKIVDNWIISKNPSLKKEYFVEEKKEENNESCIG